MVKTAPLVMGGLTGGEVKVETTIENSVNDVLESYGIKANNFAAMESKIGSSISNIGINNPIPKTFARVIPADVNPKMLGKISDKDVFVTALEDIAGLNAKQIAQKLNIPESSSGFKIISFSSENINDLASPINRTNPGFVGKGLTKNGAREFAIPNQTIPKGANIWEVK